MNWQARKRQRIHNSVAYTLVFIPFMTVLGAFVSYALKTHESIHGGDARVIGHFAGTTEAPPRAWILYGCESDSCLIPLGVEYLSTNMIDIHLTEGSYRPGLYDVLITNSDGQTVQSNNALVIKDPDF